MEIVIPIGALVAVGVGFFIAIRNKCKKNK